MAPPKSAMGTRANKLSQQNVLAALDRKSNGSKEELDVAESTTPVLQEILAKLDVLVTEVQDVKKEK